MQKAYAPTEEQLNFISFLQRHVAGHTALEERFRACLKDDVTKGINLATQPDSDITFNHSPRRMIEFLSLFSRDDRFKWYTHKWDMSAQFNIREMMDNQIKDRNVLREMAYPKEPGPVINEATFNQVWNFINFQNSGPKIYPWKNNKSESIRIGWHSIVELSLERPEIPTELLVLPDGHQFRDYIRMFKAVIEFRTDLNDEDRFSELIWNSITALLPKDFEVNFTSAFDEIGYDLNVYCDVAGIMNAIHTICNWITRHKTRSSSVEIDLHAGDAYYLLEINHKGSYFNNKEKLEHPSGDFDNLRRRLFSVCDFTMEGDYIQDGNRTGSLLVRALDNDTTQRGKTLNPCIIEERKDSTGGVKYNLKIYRETKTSIIS